jgi:hydrogenase expression/formation protein HypD
VKFVDEFRDSDTAARYVKEIARITTRPWTIMEVCGGQTHAIVKYGIDQLLPAEISLLHGPGCPVCVTPVELIDKAIQIASLDNVIFCSFGDMLRVPGSTGDLLSVKARGRHVRAVYSPLDSLRIASENPSCEVVFFAIGFETTAPANAVAIQQAQRLGLTNYSALSAQVLIPPAMEAILAASERNVQGFLAPGHVCTVMGYTEYERIAAAFGVPITVTGFEPLDILHGIHMTISQLELGNAGVRNQYARAVERAGNTTAQDLMKDVFTVVNRKWRGLGEIPKSGLALREPYWEFDAERRFGLYDLEVEESTDCISGLILQGRRIPSDCGAFGNRCTPEHPLGATMVSSEGACAAYYRYRRIRQEVTTTYAK